MRPCLCVFALVLALCVPSTVLASTLGGSGGGFSGSGTFTTTSNGDGSYTITALTGDLNSGIGALISANGFNDNDNQLYPDAPAIVDAAGFSFTDSQGDTSFQVDIFSDSSGNYFAYLDDSDLFTETVAVDFTLTSASQTQFTSFRSLSSPAYGTQQIFNFSIDEVPASPAPEPSSLILLGTGLFAACGAASRRVRI